MAEYAVNSVLADLVGKLKPGEQDKLEVLLKEYLKASRKFKEFNSTHEGYAILQEEVDELWDLVKMNRPPYDLEQEAKQVGAMALRFLVDLCWWD